MCTLQCANALAHSTTTNYNRHKLPYNLLHFHHLRCVALCALRMAGSSHCDTRARIPIVRHSHTSNFVFRALMHALQCLQHVFFENLIVEIRTNMILSFVLHVCVSGRRARSSKNSELIKFRIGLNRIMRGKCSPFRRSASCKDIVQTQAHTLAKCEAATNTSFARIHCRIVCNRIPFSAITFCDASRNAHTHFANAILVAVFCAEKCQFEVKSLHMSTSAPPNQI